MKCIMGNKAKIRINIYIDAEQHEKMKKIQERVGVLMSEQIRRGIDLWLKQQRSKDNQNALRARLDLPRGMRRRTV